MTVNLLNNAFTVGLFQFTLVPRETMFVPAVNKANMLRGAFGHAFRRLCCVPQCASAAACPLATACPYKIIFEPSPPPASARLSKNQDVPRPFVFRAPLTPKTKFQPDEQFQFGLVLIGRALDHLPYFVLSFRDLAAQGLGLNRAKAELRLVEQIKPEAWLSTPDQSHSGPDFPASPLPSGRSLNHLIYSSHDQVFRAPIGLTLEQWLAQRVQQLSASHSPGSTIIHAPESPQDAAAPSSSDSPISRSSGGVPSSFPDLPAANSAPQPLPSFASSAVNAAVSPRIAISFLTPTLLKAENAITRNPEFHHLFKRLRDRINSLSTFFGSGPLNADFAGLGLRAEQIQRLSSDVQWEERFRTSSKTRQRHELSGFTGSVTFRGPLQEFLPWLALGEFVGVGKHSAFDCGRIQLSSF